MILAITYGDDKFDGSAQVNMWSARHIGGADKTIRYRPQDIAPDFARAHADVLGQLRGGGYWVWKPYVILQALAQVAPGDYVFYADAGTVYVNKIQRLVDEAERDGKSILLSASPWKMKYWCKHDSFVLTDCDNADAYESRMVAGGYLLLRKTEESTELMEEWLHYLCDPRLSTDQASQSSGKERPEFREHRHDESIISLLAYKHHITPSKNFAEQNMYMRLRGYAKKGLFSLTLQEVWDAYESEKSEGYYTASTHGRILVNTNIRNHKGLSLYLRIFRRLVEAAVRDYGPAPKAPR